MPENRGRRSDRNVGRLVDVAPDAECGPIPCTGSGARAISSGTADLRFVAGNYVARDFPVGQPTRVRVELTHLAEVVSAGYRLALVVSRDDSSTGFSLTYAPQVVVGGSSEIVLPVTKGTVGGRKSAHSYLPRPFLPTT